MATIEPLDSIEAYKRVLEATLNTLEEVMSTDTDMTSHTQTMADADQWLDAVQAELAKAIYPEIRTHNARVARLEKVIEDASNALYDSKVQDVEHTITCHADTLPIVLRSVTKGHEQALRILQEIVQERFG